MTEQPQPLPFADSQAGLQVLRGMARERSMLSALALMRQYVGPIFQINLPKFHPAVFVGPNANRTLLVTQREQLSWRNATDPVVRLLRRGVLVVDGEEHDTYRGIMDPPMQRRNVLPHIPDFWRYTDQVTASWRSGETCDLLVEMRKLALAHPHGHDLQGRRDAGSGPPLAADPGSAGIHLPWHLDPLGRRADEQEGQAGYRRRG